MRSYPSLLASLLCLPLFACAADGGGAGDDDVDDIPDIDECPTTGRYLELAQGRSWTYEVTDDDGVVEKTQTVGALEDVGGEKAGTMAFRLTTTKDSGSTVSWQEDTGDGVVRHRELDMSGSGHTDEVYQPYRTRIDESADRLVEGTTWTDAYTEIITDAEDVTTETEKTETWTVEAVDEPLRVPAGDFCTLRVRRTSTAGGVDGSDKTYWFARGVGKVKEDAAGQIEELVAYE